MFLYRTSLAEFIFPFDQYMEAKKNNYSIGMRFKMRFEGEEAPDQSLSFFVFVFLNKINRFDYIVLL